MKILLPGLLALVAIAAGALYVGFAGSNAQPAYVAQSLDVYNLDKCGQHKWIHVADSRVVNLILAQRNAARKNSSEQSIRWIGGVVMLDPAEPGGWKFDPTSILVTGDAAEGMQTTTCTINENPGKYVGGIWYVQQGFSQYRVR